METMDIVNNNASLTNAKRTFRMQAELPTLNTIATSFIVDFPIVGKQGKPISPMIDRIAESAQNAA